MEHSAQTYEMECQDALVEHRATTQELAAQRCEHDDTLERLRTTQEVANSARQEHDQVAQELLAMSAQLEESHGQLLASHMHLSETRERGETVIEEANEQHARELKEQESLVAARKHDELKAALADVGTRRIHEHRRNNRLAGARAVSTLLTGGKVMKLSAKHQKWAVRWAGLIQNGKDYELRWADNAKSWRSKGLSTTVLKVKDIQNVDFGDHLPAAAKLPKNCRCRWQCFVLYTAQRSFCFWAENEALAIAFIIGSSLLAPQAQLVTPREIRWRWALCKLGQDPAARGKAILQALKKASANRVGTSPRQGAAAGILKKEVVHQPGPSTPSGATAATSARSPSPHRRVSWGVAEVKTVEAVMVQPEDDEDNPNMEGNDPADFQRIESDDSDWNSEVINRAPPLE